MKHSSDYRPYRVGIARDWERLRGYLRDPQWSLTARVRLVRTFLRELPRSMARRSWWGFWQAEWTGCRRAARGFTAAHARHRAIHRKGKAR
jgi:hypothetical protein